MSKYVNISTKTKNVLFVKMKEKLHIITFIIYKVYELTYIVNVIHQENIDIFFNDKIPVTR